MKLKDKEDNTIGRCLLIILLFCFYNYFFFRGIVATFGDIFDPIENLPAILISIVIEIIVVIIYCKNGKRGL